MLHHLLNTNLTEVNMKIPINFSIFKVMAFVGKPVIAQYMPKFHMPLTHTVWYNENKVQS